jgi:hypothetical protein
LLKEDDLGEEFPMKHRTFTPVLQMPTEFRLDADSHACFHLGRATTHDVRRLRVAITPYWQTNAAVEEGQAHLEPDTAKHVRKRR